MKKFKKYIRIEITGKFYGWNKKDDKETNLCFSKLSIGCIFCAIKLHGTNIVCTMLSTNVSIGTFKQILLKGFGVSFKIANMKWKMFPTNVHIENYLENLQIFPTFEIDNIWYEITEKYTPFQTLYCKSR